MAFCHMVTESVEAAQLCWTLVPLERPDQVLRDLVVSIRNSSLGIMLVSSVREYQI